MKVKKLENVKSSIENPTPYDFKRADLWWKKQFARIESIAYDNGIEVEFDWGFDDCEIVDFFDYGEAERTDDEILEMIKEYM